MACVSILDPPQASISIFWNNCQIFTKSILVILKWKSFFNNLMHDNKFYEILSEA